MDDWSGALRDRGLLPLNLSAFFSLCALHMLRKQHCHCRVGALTVVLVGIERGVTSEACWLLVPSRELDEVDE